MNKSILLILVLLIVTLLPSCVHYSVKGNFPSESNVNSACSEGSAKERQLCRNEIDRIKQAIAKN